MSISSVSDTTSYWKEATAVATEKTTGSSSLDFQSFIELLATELKYQDPMDPVSSTEYVAQLAQFSSLEKLNDIGNAVDASQAYSLIGKTVVYSATNSAGQTVSYEGVVDSVTVKSGTPYLNIGDTQIAFSSVKTVSDS